MRNNLLLFQIFLFNKTICSYNFHNLLFRLVVLNYTNFFIKEFSLKKKEIIDDQSDAKHFFYDKLFLLSRYILSFKVHVFDRERKKKSKRTLPINTEKLFISFHFFPFLFPSLIFIV